MSPEPGKINVERFEVRCSWLRASPHRAGRGKDPEAGVRGVRGAAQTPRAIPASAMLCGAADRRLPAVVIARQRHL